MKIRFRKPFVWVTMAALLAAHGSVDAASTPLPPRIVSQPRPQTTMLGGRAVFTVATDGTPPLSYQWMKNGVSLIGANEYGLILDNAEFSDAGSQMTFAFFSRSAFALLSADPLAAPCVAPRCLPGHSLAAAYLLKWAVRSLASL